MKVDGLPVPAPCGGLAAIVDLPAGLNGGGTCQPANLSFTLGAKIGGTTTQPTQVVDLTNKGSSACTMDGFRA
jgi:hypothetical protein